MQSITRYIFNQLFAAALFITLGLTLAIWLSQSLRWISYIVNQGLPTSTFFYFVGLLLPSFLGIILPIAAFCAVLFVYYKLVLDSEMMVRTWFAKRRNNYDSRSPTAEDPDGP